MDSSPILVLTVFAVIVAYILGSIPFGLIFTRLFGLGDIRMIGSGNIGATNVLRTGNKKIAALTLLCDLLKGTIAVLIPSMFIAHSNFSSPVLTSVAVIAPLAGLSAFLGHVFPVWLKFRGGKGVATFLGVILALYWPSAVLFAVLWLAVAYFTRYSSLAALVSVIVVPIFVAAFGRGDLALWVAVMSIIVVRKHKLNIQRLRQGTENKIGKSR